MSLSANEIVNVVATISPTGLLRRDFGRALFLTTDQTIPPQQRTRVYSGTDGIQEDFAVGTAPYEGAAIYFQQDPYPKNLVVGRWINSASAASVTGGQAAALADFQAINDGSFLISASIVPDYTGAPTDELSVTGLDFTSALSLQDVNDVIAAALAGLHPVEWWMDIALVDGSFVIAADDSQSEDVLAISYASTAPVGTDVSAMLGLTAETAVDLRYAAIVETVEEALAGCESTDGTFYFIGNENALNGTTAIDDISAWVASRDYMMAAEFNNVTALVGGDTQLNGLAALAPPRTFATWSATPDYKALSAAGRMGSINFNANDSIITLKFKQLPGTLPDAGMTPTQAQQLQDKLTNFYSERSGAPMYEEGYTMKQGTWIDVRYWLDWFVNAVRVEVFNAFYSSGKVPQTEAGMNLVKDSITLVCDQGVANGGIAGGQLSPALTASVKAKTGNTTFDGFLTGGYLVYADPMATLPQSERDQRKAPPFYVFLKGAGAIHGADILVTFEN